nr:MAG TPA: hypothetical protein [Caudoviricetes sp.]
MPALRLRGGHKWQQISVFSAIPSLTPAVLPAAYPA